MIKMDPFSTPQCKSIAKNAGTCLEKYSKMEALLLENWLQCPHPRDRFTTREYTFKRQVFSLIIDPTFNMAATKFYVAISATNLHRVKICLHPDLHTCIAHQFPSKAPVFNVLVSKT